MIKNIKLRIEVEQDTDKYGPHSIDYDLVKNETSGILDRFPAEIVEVISNCIMEIESLASYVLDITPNRSEE